ncbi:MAG: hypothetical protein ACOY4Q_01410 [Bacillota bacterium]
MKPRTSCTAGLRLACIAVAACLMLLSCPPPAGAHPFWENPYYFVKRIYTPEKQRVDWQIIEEGGVHWGHEEGNDERNWRFTFKTRAEADAKGREIDTENTRIMQEGKNPLENAFLNGAVNFATAYSQAGLKGKPGTLEKLTAELIQSVADFLLKFLGLNTMEELVYNQGTKAAYIYGIFPKDKWAANKGLYLRIYSVAWLLMFLPPVWIFMKKALSTVNPGIRSSLIGGLLTYFISLALMGAVFPVLHFFFWVNDAIIRWFYDGNMVGFFHDAVPGEGFLGAAIVRLAFITLTLYYNFTYRVRAFVLSLLMVMAPLFIFFINFDKTRNITITFGKEILFNIFVQSFHAVSLYYFVITLGVSGVWDKIVLLIVFIPLTEMLRRMIMGSGTVSGHLAALAGMATVGAVAGVMRAGKNSFRARSGGADSGGAEPAQSKPEQDAPSAGLGRAADMQSAGGWLKRGFNTTTAGAASEASRPGPSYSAASSGPASPPSGDAGRLQRAIPGTLGAAGTAAGTAAGACLGLPFGPAGAALGAEAGYLGAQKIALPAGQNRRTGRRVINNRSAEDDPEVVR